MDFIDTHLQFQNLTPRTRTTRIVVHHSASPDVPAAEIHRWHLALGWSGIGYHYVIRTSGSIELGRPVAAVGAHTQGCNEDSIGICLTGDFMQAAPAASQLQALQQLISTLQQQYGPLEIFRHRDLNPTSCPGDKFPWDELCPEDWKRQLMDQARTDGFISGEHNPDDPAPKWFVLAVAQNLRNQK
jgi:N-acetyl-anhydromuramyl-L-alanine amidase AmpD